MATITVEVDGVAKTTLFSLKAGISWNNAINGRGQASMVLRDTVGEFEPVDGDKVVIKEDGTERFYGMITDVEKHLIGPDAANALTEYQIEVGGYELLIEKRRVWGRYNHNDIGSIIASINTLFFNGEGLTTNVDLGATGNITVSFNGETGAQAMDLIMELADDGRTWWITAGLVLTSKPTTAVAAPVTITKDNILMDPPPTVGTDRSTYVNRQHVRGGVGEHPTLGRWSDTAEIATRAAAELGSGIYEAVSDQPEIKAIAFARSAAHAKVLKHGRIRATFVGATRVSGFEPGQQVTVNLPNLGLSSQVMFIEEVDTSLVPGGQGLEHTISCITQDPSGGWRQFWRDRRRFPPQARFWEVPATTNVGKSRPPTPPVEQHVAERHTEEGGQKVSEPRLMRGWMATYTSDGINQLVDTDGGFLAPAMLHKSGGEPVEKVFIKSNASDPNDLDSVPESSTRKVVGSGGTGDLDDVPETAGRKVIGSGGTGTLDEVDEGAAYKRLVAASADSSGRVIRLRRTASDLDPDDISKKVEVVSHIGGENDDEVDTGKTVTDSLDASAVISGKVSGIGSAASGTATDGSFVNVTSDATFEMQHDFNTADRWEQWTHSNNRASYKNVSGGNSGYTISRTRISDS